MGGSPCATWRGWRRSAITPTGTRIWTWTGCREWNEGRGLFPRGREHAVPPPRISSQQFHVPVKPVVPAFVPIVGREGPAMFLQLPARRADRRHVQLQKIGRALGREKGCQYG